MTKPIRIDFDPAVLAALEARAAAIHRSMSELVNDIVHDRLAEDLEDQAAFDARAGEPTRSLQEVCDDFNARGLL